MSQLSFYGWWPLTMTFFLLFTFSVNDLRRLIEKAGGKLDHSLYAQSATHVGSLSHQVSQPFPIFRGKYSSKLFSTLNQRLGHIFSLLDFIFENNLRIIESVMHLLQEVLIIELDFCKGKVRIEYESCKCSYV